MATQPVVFGCSGPGLVWLLLLLSSRQINSRLIEFSTVKAVPLKDQTTIIPEVLVENPTTYAMRQEDGSTTPSTENPGIITENTEINDEDAKSSSTGNISTEPSADITEKEAPSSPPGRIAWSPYSSLARSTVSAQELRSPMVLFPELGQAKGRWESRDQVEAQILNIRPAFLLPVLEVNEDGDGDDVQEVANGDDDIEYGDEYEGEDDGSGDEEQVDADLTVPEGQSQSGNETMRMRRRKRAVGPMRPTVATCGGVYRELYGVLESPEFPLYYPNNKNCIYDIEVPSDNYTVKITCDAFTMQGGHNCTHDYLLVSPTGNLSFPDGEKYCGAKSPVILSSGNRIVLQFRSDDLFRYQGFSCRYRALQPNGIAVVGSFGNTLDNTKPKHSGTSFIQITECTNLGAAANTADGSGSGEGSAGAGASLYSGLWNGQCGNQNLPPTSRIVGGWSTAEHQFPWIAAVLRTCGVEYCQICGATIISEEWILTGAHCMANVPMSELGVLVGDHNLYTVNNDQKFIRVKEKMVHPDYNTPTPLNNDIGLLRLENPIVFTKFISPLCLPALGETGFGGSAYGTVNTTRLDTTGLDIVGKNATVLGWGMINDDGEYAESLRGVQVEILDNEECNRLYGIMTETMMCTSGHNGRGTCYGDSGGPAIVQQPDGSYVQVGILAFGALAGCELGYPSGQVLVHKYIDWIQAVTGEAFGR